MSEERYCVTCKHHVTSGTGHECYCPAISKMDMVTGQRRREDCIQQRSENGWNLYRGKGDPPYCGPQGRYWEQAEGPRDSYRSSTDWSQAYQRDQGWKGE